MEQQMPTGGGGRMSLGGKSITAYDFLDGNRSAALSKTGLNFDCV
jgi:hypothetical protein